MRTVAAPPDSGGDTYETCASRVQNTEKRTRLLAAKAQIVAANDSYSQKARATQLHTFPTATGIPDVRDDELKGLYRQLTDKQSPGRRVYDRIKNAAEVCPLCGANKATTLDHHLPRTRYPAIAVAPKNLVPACKDCQGEKMEAFPASAEEQSLHPYFDNPQSALWLVASVQEVSPPGVVFSVTTPVGWTALQAARCEHHLKTFGLKARYSSLAGEELSNMKWRLNELHKAGGPDAVRLHLIEEAKSRRAAWQNSWQTATYEACATSTWFCSVGLFEV